MIDPDPSNPAFLAWAAAWVDTEGSIGMRADRSDPLRTSARYRVRVDVSQVVSAPLLLLQQGFGGAVTGPHRHASNGNGRPIYRYIVQDRKADALLRAVRPYLLVKAAQADLAIQVAPITDANRRRPRPTDSTARLESIKHELHTLNGWSAERLERARVIGARRGPQPIGRWSTEHDACSGCGSTERRHTARGLCRLCYMTAYNKASWAKHKTSRAR